MKSVFILLMAIGIAISLQAQPNNNKEVMVKLAVLAAPVELRDSASVYSFDDAGNKTVLREGTNPIICLADDPAQKGLSVSCYHRDIEPFMQRGRDLKAQGKSFKEIFDIREEEVKSGKLKMNTEPSTLYAFSAAAEDYDSIAGTVKNGYLRYVVYIPYATSNSTGLPVKPDVPGMPWIMDPGTHRAHIMISPAKQ